jgi:hypothetical protein
VIRSKNTDIRSIPPSSTFERVGGLASANVARHRDEVDRSDEDRAITEVIDRLAKQFPQLPADEVAQVVGQSRPEFDDAPIREFVPLFVERGAKARLRQLVQIGS